jgi:hypothetical protein
METVYTIALVLGGIVLVFQFVLSMLGLGDHDGDIGGVHHGDFGGGDYAGGHDGGLHHVDGADASHLTNWFYEIISIRTLAAGATFFGLTGNGSLAWGYSPYGAFIMAAAAGFGAMYGVYWIYKQMYRLQNSGTENIRNAIGAAAVVYVPIPASGAGRGKVTFRLQNRLVEYLAVTDEETRLATGEKVVVVAIAGSDTVRVARDPAAAERVVSTATTA